MCVYICACVCEWICIYNICINGYILDAWIQLGTESFMLKPTINKLINKIDFVVAFGKALN